MEEMNQNNEEVVTEQRPSTKYGRTAYQQQMQEEQENAQQEPNMQEQNPYQENPYQENPYQQWQNPYQQNPYQQYTPYEEPKQKVKQVFAYILMVLIAITGIINLVTTMLSAEAYHIGNSLEDVVNATLAIAEQPLFSVLSTFGDFIFIATVVLFVFDIRQLYKAGNKITGSILFAIFLRPAYFIWRAYLLGQKKAGPIVYTICVYLLSFIGFFVMMLAASAMVLRTMY